MSNKAIFISRPNRYEVVCLFQNKEIIAHLPNPGRLSELLFPNSILEIELAPPSKTRKTKYTAIGIWKDDLFIALHTHRLNYVTKQLVESNNLPSIGSLSLIKQEVSHAKSRFDFLVAKEGQPFFLESKSCTLYTTKAAIFPDAPTLRGTKHVSELYDLAKQGNEAAIVFVIQNPLLSYFLPNFHTDLTFALTLLEARKKVRISPAACKITPQFNIDSPVKELPIPWEIVEREAKNQGCYLWVGYLPQDTNVAAGKLKPQVYRKGYYMYIGSAKTNLDQRIARHSRLRKKQHWHFDYLRPFLEKQAHFAIRTQDGIECELATQFTQLADWHILDFGSSDCHCPSHLLGFEINPLLSPSFFTLLHFFQIDRFLN